MKITSSYFHYIYIYIFYNSENFKLKYFLSEDNLFLYKESLSHSCIIFSLLLELFNVKNIKELLQESFYYANF